MPAHVRDDAGRKAISLYMGPSPLVPNGDDLEAAVVRFIDGAKRSLDIAVQELESVPIAEAILRAKNDRGVRVRIVLESDYLRETTKLKIEDKWKPVPIDARSRGNEPNREVFSALLRSRLDVRTDYNANIFHQKFIVRDKNRKTAALLTGSTNFTPTGVANNLNHVIIVYDNEVAKDYDREFREIWRGEFGRRPVRTNDRPREHRVAGVRVKPLFAPEHSPEMEVMKQVLKTRERLDFAIFTFSNSSGIDDTLLSLDAWDVTVRGILDGSQGRQSWAPTHELAALPNFEMYLSPKRGQLGKLHHKLMVIDDNVVIGGSFNYTGAANRFNDENILVIGDVDESDPVAAHNQAVLGRYARHGVDQIIDEFGIAV
ncbi:MAG: phospholipase [Myxococcales bacterium FL481]|nr:MAG: phospholipase [Myxococcales bacterium FL481]